jgi:hypothetical protein
MKVAYLQTGIWSCELRRHLIVYECCYTKCYRHTLLSSKHVIRAVDQYFHLSALLLAPEKHCVGGRRSTIWLHGSSRQPCVLNRSFESRPRTTSQYCKRARTSGHLDMENLVLPVRQYDGVRRAAACGDMHAISGAVATFTQISLGGYATASHSASKDSQGDESHYYSFSRSMFQGLQAFAQSPIHAFQRQLNPPPQQRRVAFDPHFQFSMHFNCRIRLTLDACAGLCVRRMRSNWTVTCQLYSNRCGPFGGCIGSAAIGNIW